MTSDSEYVDVVSLTDIFTGLIFMLQAERDVSTTCYMITHGVYCMWEQSVGVVHIIRISY